MKASMDCYYIETNFKFIHDDFKNYYIETS